MPGDIRSRVYVTPMGNKLVDCFPKVYTHKDYFGYADAVDNLVSMWLQPDQLVPLMDMRELGFNNKCSEHPFIFAYISEMVRFSKLLFIISEKIKGDANDADEIRLLCRAAITEMVKTLSNLSLKYMPEIDTLSSFDAKLCLESQAHLILILQMLVASSLEGESLSSYKAGLKNNIVFLVSQKTKEALRAIGKPLSDIDEQTLRDIYKKEEFNAEDLATIKQVINFLMDERSGLNAALEALCLPIVNDSQWLIVVSCFKKTIKYSVENYAIFWMDAYSDLDPFSWRHLQSFVSLQNIPTLPKIKINNLSFIESMAPNLEGLKDKNDFYKQRLYTQFLILYENSIKTLEEKNKLRICENFVKKENEIFFANTVRSMMMMLRKSSGVVFEGQRFSSFQDRFDSYVGVDDIVGLTIKAKNIFLEKKCLIKSIVKVVSFYSHADRIGLLSLGALMSLVDLFKSINTFFESVDANEISCFQMFFYNEILVDLKITEDIFLKVLMAIKEKVKELKKGSDDFVANSVIKNCIEMACGNGSVLYRMELIKVSESILCKFYPKQEIAKTLKGFLKDYAEKPGQNGLISDLNTFVSTLKIFDLDLERWLGSEDFTALKSSDLPGMIVFEKESLGGNQTISSKSYQEILLSTNKKFSEQFKKATLLVGNPKMLKAGFLLMTVSLLTGVHEKNVSFVEKVLYPWIKVSSADLKLLVIDRGAHWILYMMLKCLSMNEGVEASDDKILSIFVTSALKSIQSFYENGLCLTPENKKTLQDLLSIQRLKELFDNMDLDRILTEEEQAESAAAAERVRFKEDQRQRETVSKQKSEEEKTRAAKEMAEEKIMKKEEGKKSKKHKKKDRIDEAASSAQSILTQEPSDRPPEEKPPADFTVSEFNSVKDDFLIAESGVNDAGSSVTDSVLSRSPIVSSLTESQPDAFDMNLLRQEFEEQMRHRDIKISWQQWLIAYQQRILFGQQAQINQQKDAIDQLAAVVFSPRVPVYVPALMYSAPPDPRSGWVSLPENPNLIFHLSDPGLVYNIKPE